MKIIRIRDRISTQPCTNHTGFMAALKPSLLADLGEAPEAIWALMASVRVTAE